MASAKYIEGLENRLGRMESLLKLSGLLNEEDGDRTDLGTLEKRLADQTNRNSSPATSSKSPNESSNTLTPAPPSSESHHATPKSGNSSTPKSTVISPEPAKDANKERGKDGEEEVEALSDMMCSLVTNNCGETRYIGMAYSGISLESAADGFQAPRPDSRFSRPKAYSGSMKRQEIVRFKR